MTFKFWIELERECARRRKRRWMGSSGTFGASKIRKALRNSSDMRNAEGGRGCWKSTRRNPSASFILRQRMMRANGRPKLRSLRSAGKLETKARPIESWRSRWWAAKGLLNYSWKTGIVLRFRIVSRWGSRYFWIWRRELLSWTRKKVNLLRLRRNHYGRNRRANAWS